MKMLEKDGMNLEVITKRYLHVKYASFLEGEDVVQPEYVIQDYDILVYDALWGAVVLFSRILTPLFAV
jgi:hypothetical protein